MSWDSEWWDDHEYMHKTVGVEVEKASNEMWLSEGMGVVMRVILYIWYIVEATNGLHSAQSITWFVNYDNSPVANSKLVSWHLPKTIRTGNCEYSVSLTSVSVSSPLPWLYHAVCNLCYHDVDGDMLYTYIRTYVVSWNRWRVKYWSKQVRKCILMALLGVWAVGWHSWFS